VLPDLERFVPDLVFKAGKIVAESGSVVHFPAMPIPDYVRNTVHVPKLSTRQLEILAGDDDSHEIRVVELIPDQVTTRVGHAAPRIVNGRVVADPEHDLAKLVVVERHHASGRMGIGFVRGFNLRHGAFASTVAHDAHNVIAAGKDDGDIVVAINALARLGGGLCVVDRGEVVTSLRLPIAGLMSDRPAEEVDQGMRRLDAALARLGVTIPTPFMYLSFLALSVIPEIRVTDQGIVDVDRFELVPLISG
jgi:adenine deaminase